MSRADRSAMEVNARQNLFWDASIITLLDKCKWSFPREQYGTTAYDNIKDILLYTQGRHGSQHTIGALKKFFTEERNTESFSGIRGRSYMASLSDRETKGFLEIMYGRVSNVMGRCCRNINSFSNPNIKTDYEEIFFDEKVISYLSQYSFPNSEIFERLRKSLLDTCKEHGPVWAVNALKCYIATGNFSNISGNENKKYIGTKTSREQAKDFLGLVTNKYIDIIQEETLGMTRNQASKQRDIKSARTVQGGLRGNIPQRFHNGLYVVSDLHGDINQLGKVEEKVRQRKKVIVLGDATDRGDYGIEILQRLIMLQQETRQNENTLLEYVPGNHDLFLYEALHKGLMTFENTRDIRSMQQYVVNSCNNYLQNPIHQRNGLTPTYAKLKDLVLTKPMEVYQLGKWLGQQPLLRAERDNGKNVALGHAAFDMDVYKSGYTLQRYMEDKERNPDSILCSKAFLCLWYRDKDPEMVNSALKYLNLPSQSFAHDIVIGHTPHAVNVYLQGMNGSRNAICVDYASHKNGAVNKTMGKYEPWSGLEQTTLECYNIPSNWPVNAQQKTISAARSFVANRSKANIDYQMNNNARQTNRGYTDNYRQ